MPCMPSSDAPVPSALRCSRATVASVACVNQKVRRRAGSVTNRSTMAMTQAIANNTISGYSTCQFMEDISGPWPQLSLLCATCCSSSVTDTCITSVKGFGYTPIQSTATASSASIRNSRRSMSTSALTCSLAASPK